MIIMIITTDKVGGWCISYPVTAAVGTEGLGASFHDKLIFWSPMNTGNFECNGWIIKNVIDKQEKHAQTWIESIGKKHWPESLPVCCCSYEDQW